MDVFPKSKVILTIRDPDTWYDSVQSTIYELHRSTEGTRMGFLKITGQYRMVKTMSSILYYTRDGIDQMGKICMIKDFVSTLRKIEKCANVLI